MQLKCKIQKSEEFLKRHDCDFYIDGLESFGQGYDVMLYHILHDHDEITDISGKAAVAITKLIIELNSKEHGNKIISTKLKQKRKPKTTRLNDYEIDTSGPEWFLVKKK